MRFNLRAKIIAGYLVTVLLTSVISYVAILNVNRIVKLYEKTLRGHYTLVLTTADLKLAASKEAMGIRGFLVTGDDKFLLTYEEGKRQFAEAADKLRTMVHSQESRDLLEKVNEVEKTYIAICEKEIDLHRQGRTKEAFALLGADGLRLQAELYSLCDSFLTRERSIMEAGEVAAAEVSKTLGSFMLGVALIAILIGVDVGILVSHRVSKNVRAIATATLKMAEGNLAQRVHLKSKDEIGDLAKAFNQMADNLFLTQGELIKVKNYNQSIVENIPSGVLAIDRDGRITTFNKSAESITLLDSAQILGKYYQEMIEIREIGKLIKETLDSSSAYRAREFSLKRKDGKNLSLRISTSPFSNENGVLLGVVAIFDDVTEIKELEEKTQRAERLASLGSMATQVVHEVRNPLAGIASAIQILEERGRTNDEERKVIKVISKEIDRLDNIIEEMLSYTRPLRLQLSLGNINNLLEKLFFFVRDKVENQGIIVERDLAKDLPKIRVDGEQMQRALLNIVLNAIQAMPKGGKLLVRTYLNVDQESKSLSIAIADTGTGIPREHLPKLFDPFFTTKAKGTGLGLSIAQRIVEEHKGTITVSSEPGRGTIFTITLPLST